MLGRVLHGSFDLASAVQLRRFERSLARAPDINEKLLARLLRANADTWFGKEHGFRDIRSPEDYAKAVPLRDYEAFRPMVDRIADGEADVLTAEPVRYLGLTSGTTGRGKLVPITASAQRQIMAHMVLTTRGVMARHRRGGRSGPGLLLMSSVLPSKTKAGIPIGTGTATGLDRMGAMAKLFWSSPLEVFRVRSHRAAQHLHLLFALAREDLSFLSAPFASALADLLRVLEADGPALVEELATGVLSPALDIAPELRGALELRADPDRAERVRRALEPGLEGAVPRLWPELAYAMGVATGSFAVYEPPLRRALGDRPLYTGLYAATEGLIGMALEPDARSYAIDPLSQYFELIPAEESDAPAPTALVLREAREGGLYELVLTTRSGFYRYRLGDVVRVVGFRGSSPLVEYSHRRGMLLDLASEKTSEPALRDAVLEAGRRWGTDVVDYTSAADYRSSPERYEVFVELARAGALDGWAEPGGPLEEALQKGNPGYGLLRSSGRLAGLTLHRVRPGTFDELKALLVRQGASQAQVKVPRVLSRPEIEALVRTRVEKSWRAPDSPSGASASAT